MELYLSQKGRSSKQLVAEGAKLKSGFRTLSASELAQKLAH